MIPGDICRDILIKLTTTQANFRSHKHEIARLHRVANNVCTDFMRSPSKRSTFNLDDIGLNNSHGGIEKLGNEEEVLVARADYLQGDEPSFAFLTVAFSEMCAHRPR